MSITLNLEADERLSREVAKAVLLGCGLDWISEDESGLKGNFSESNMYFSLRDNAESFPCEVLAEDVPYPLKWKVGSRLSLNVVLEHYTKCCNQVVGLLFALEKNTPANFVLSFQYEEVYAVRDAGGVTIYKDPCG